MLGHEATYPQFSLKWLTFSISEEGKGREKERRDGWRIGSGGGGGDGCEEAIVRDEIRLQMFLSPKERTFFIIAIGKKRIRP